MAITNILVPFDGSSFSVKAFNAAIDIAKKQNVKIFILTCLEKNNLGAWYKDKRVNRQIVNDAKKFALGFLTKLEKRAEKSGISVTAYIHETESIPKQIVSFANSKKIDLIVIGSHGQTGFNRLLLGSVSNGVSQYSKCPVLIIK